MTMTWAIVCDCCRQCIEDDADIAAKMTTVEVCDGVVGNDEMLAHDNRADHGSVNDGGSSLTPGVAMVKTAAIAIAMRSVVVMTTMALVVATWCL